MRNLITLLIISITSIPIYSQGDMRNDTIYEKTYRLGREVTEDELISQIKQLLKQFGYEIEEEEPIETSEKRFIYKKNEANLLKRLVLIKDFNYYPIVYKNILIYKLKENGKANYNVYSFAKLDSTGISDSLIQEIEKRIIPDAVEEANKDLDIINEIARDLKKKNRNNDM